MLHESERRIEGGGKTQDQMVRDFKCRPQSSSFSTLRSETMKTKTSIGMLSLLAFLLACGALPGAQREGAFVTPRAGTMSVWNVNEGRARLGVRLTDVNA